MLLGFKIKNFRSYNELQHFSMAVGRTKNHLNHIVDSVNPNLLTFSAIYGANASGKSNLVLAMDLGKRLLFESTNGIIPNQYFRFIPKEKDEATYFEYEVNTNNKNYSYGFEINLNNKELISEWLIDMTNNREVVIFERDLINNSITSKLKIESKEDKNRFHVYTKDLMSNNKVFFLSEMIRRIDIRESKNNSFIDFINVYNFFLNELNIITGGTNIDIPFFYISKHKEKISMLFNKLGLDVSKIDEVDSSIDEIQKLMPSYAFDDLMLNIRNNTSHNINSEVAVRINNSIYIINGDIDNIKVKAIKLFHKDIEFDTYEESSGTLKILELIDILLSKNKVYVIDDFENSLHPLLTYKFIEIFLSIAKENNVQLIVSTHELYILTYNLLRRDEVWITEKGEDGSTKLYSLEQFKDDARYDRKIDKAYTDGRFGGIPIFNENKNQ